MNPAYLTLVTKIQQQMFASNKEWARFQVKGAVELPDKTFKFDYDILAVKVRVAGRYYCQSSQERRPWRLQ